MRKEEEIRKRLWNVIDEGFTKKAFIKLPDCKRCTVVWGRNENGYEHVSVAPTKQFAIPSWNDMCFLKDVFFEDEEEAYQIHPKKSEYVNVKNNCLHLWRKKEEK